MEGDGLPATAPVSRAELDAVEVALANLDPVRQAQAAIRWVTERFGLDKVILTASMSDTVLTHLASGVAPGVRVLFLDTGYHFAETLGTADAVSAMLPIELVTVTPLLSVAEQDQRYGERLYERRPDQCCRMRKVEPLERGLAGNVAWMSGVRRVETFARAGTRLIGWDARRQMVKVNPLASWDDTQVEDYAAGHNVLVNPLREIGYTSIGCEPCTQPTEEGDDPRAGRWAGRGKTECGLHI
ncbi:MAG: phosphoadenylyl-sulfate reductase [Candidatus Nanopelagicales bacterium]